MFPTRDVLPPLVWGQLRETFPEGRKPRYKHLSMFDGYLLVCGHFGRSILSEFAISPQIVTMLRDPVQRAVSQYKHIMYDRRRNHQVPESLYKSTTTLEEMLDDDRREYFKDQMIKYLSVCPPFEEVLRNQSDKHRGYYAEYLHGAECYPVVASKFALNINSYGIFEHLTESFLLISHSLGLPLFIPDVQISTVHYKYTPSDKVLQTLRDLNTQDIILYNGLESLFWKRYRDLCKSVLQEKLSVKDIKENRQELSQRLIEKVGVGQLWPTQ